LPGAPHKGDLYGRVDQETSHIYQSCAGQVQAFRILARLPPIAQCRELGAFTLNRVRLSMQLEPRPWPLSARKVLQARHKHILMEARDGSARARLQTIARVLDASNIDPSTKSKLKEVSGFDFPPQTVFQVVGPRTTQLNRQHGQGSSQNLFQYKICTRTAERTSSAYTADR
jgi:hypothetical protein